MKIRSTLVRATISVLVANATLVLGLENGNASPSSDAAFEARLNALQAQIDEMKRERRRSRTPGDGQVEPVRFERKPKPPEGGVEKQQEAIERRVNKLDQTNVNAPNFDNPTLSVSGRSLGNIMTLPQDISVSLHGTLAVFGASEHSSANNVSGARLNPIAADAFAVLAPAVNFQYSNDLSYGVKSVLWIAQTGAGTGSNENNTTTQGVPAFIVHYAYGYAESERFGTFSVGQVAGTWTSMEVGNPDLDSGGWDSLFRGGLPNVIPGNVRPFYLHGTTNALDSTLKISYITPPFQGVSFGASFEPNSNGIKEGSFTCSAAATGCASLGASPSAADIGRRRKNTVDAAIKYHKEFGDYTFNASAGVLYGSSVSYDGPPTTAAVKFLPLKIGRFGAELGGPLGPGRFIISGNTEFGQTEDLFAFQPVGASNAFEYIVGATYLIDRWKFAAAYFNNTTSGFYDPGVTGRHQVETGPEAEIAYRLTDHWRVLASFLYGTRQQQGFNFITQTVGSASNKVTSQTVGLGTQFDW